MKCDESLPICGQCQHFKTACDYHSATHWRPENAGVLSCGRSQFAMSRQSARVDVLGVLEADERQFSAGKLRIKSIDVLQLLDHFVNDHSPWMGSPDYQNVIQKHGVKLGLGAPHFLHAILAYSAGHLDYLRSDPKLRITTVHHCSRLLALYAAQIPHASTENVTQLFGSCTLLTMLSYLGVAYDNPDPDCKPEEHQCDWNAFRSLQGVRLLQGVPALRAHLRQSVWLPVLQESGPWEGDDWASPVASCQATWSSRTMEELCAVCGVSPDLRDTDSPYLDPLRRLNRIIHQRMDEAMIGPLMQFVATLSPAYMDAAEQLDPKAFIILCYWHALLLKVGQWWIVRTATGACRRTCAYLWEVGGDDIRRLLQFPAAQCGLNLASLG